MRGRWSPGGGSSSALSLLSYRTAIPLDGSSFIKSAQIGDAGTTFTVGNVVAGGNCKIALIADGVNIPTFTGFTVDPNGDAYNNIAGRLHNLYFYNDGEINWVLVRDTGLFMPVNVKLINQSGLTASGDAIGGFNYVANALNQHDASAVGISSKKIATGTDGYFQYTLGGYTPAGLGGLLALKTSQAVGAFSTAAVGIFVDTANVYKVSTGGSGALPATQRNVAAGDVIRIGRLGANNYAAVSSDGGVTFTTLQTWAATAGNLWGLLVQASNVNPSLDLTGGGVVV